MNEFNSAFCSVTYVERDQVVLLTWKQFACGDDYRRPTSFASGLLGKYPGSRLIVDARNGFEDDQADVEWGFSVLLPGMAQTGCKTVCFIMNEVNEIEEEMNLWTKEFGKYFAVIQASDYADALQKMTRMLLVSVRYRVLPGKRDAFFQKMREAGIPAASKAEPGNYQYDCFYPMDSPDDLCLLEIWVSKQAQKLHGEAAHYKKLAGFKREYVESVEL